MYLAIRLLHDAWNFLYVTEGYRTRLFHVLRIASGYLGFKEISLTVHPKYGLEISYTFPVLVHFRKCDYLCSEYCTVTVNSGKCLQLN